MKRMWNLPSLTLLAALSLVGGCSSGGGAFRASEDFTLAETWDNYERVEVRSRNGKVSLSSAAVDQIMISGTKQARGYTIADAESNVQQLTVFAGPHADQPGTFLIELRYPVALRNKSVGATFTIEVPQRCSAIVDTSNGSINVKALSGTVVLDSSNGALFIADVEGSVKADTSNGRVEAHDVTGELVVSTSNGSVIAENVGGRCEVGTSNGNVRYVSGPAVNDDIDLRSSNGSIQMTVPELLDADLELSTSNGRVRLNMGEASMKHLDHGKTHLRGTMNAGGRKLTARTSNGSITLDCR